MGKNTNQIATWKDLNDYGFIIPSDKQNSLECVTYGDINGLNSTNPGISFNTSYYIHVPGSNVNTGVAPDKINTASTNITASQTNTIGNKYWIYRFLPTNVGLASTKTITCPIKYSLYHTSTKRYPGKLLVRVLVYRGHEGGPSGNALITGNWKDLKTWTSNTSVTSGSSYATNQNIGFDWPTTETDFSDIDDTNKYFYICVEFQIVPSSGNPCNMRMVSTAPDDYTGTPSNITFYSSKKCVPYQFINKNPTKTITCHINELVAGKTSANKVTFKYYYKINNTWYNTNLGVCEIKDTSNDNGRETNTILIPIIPTKSVSGTVTEDYLYVHCGTSGGNLTWSYRYCYNGSWTSYSSGTKATSIVAERLLSISYKNCIANLSEIEFYLT